MTNIIPSIKPQEYRDRLKQVSRKLGALAKRASLVLPTASGAFKSHDQNYPFTQDRDFLYFTGFEHLEDSVLVLVSGRNRPVLLVKNRSAKQKLWDGPGVTPDKAAAALGLEVIHCDDLTRETKRLIHQSEVLYLNTARSSFSRELANALLAMPLYDLQKYNLPHTIAHSQSLISPLRAVKSNNEIQLIREAVSLTESALIEVLRVTRPGCTEIQLAKLFEGLVREAGGSLAFSSIVASGPNAAVLHHTPSERKLRKGELVLFDVGAEFGCYNGDISRTVSLGAPEKIERMLTRVDAAQERIAKLLKVGTVYSKIKPAAQEIIASELIKSDLPVRGSAAKMVKSGEILKFFPHGFGHSLGLDVHDPIDPDTVLAPGMVFTVEPGVYLNKKLGSFSPFGIRIEDDFFVSKSGPKIFSSIPQLIEL